ncbi:MAG TPA: nucleotidyltransferase domain-containing protein [Clostridia bacterium]|nr:nucleotidyltransferase domain-containing protein [Clostridia bacterium]
MFIFGTLTRKDAFTDSSDIDIAISGLDQDVSFWKMYSEVMNILTPFDFDLVELEKIEPGFRKDILTGGEEI